jgi:hypothetical protein
MPALLVRDSPLATPDSRFAIRENLDLLARGFELFAPRCGFDAVLELQADGARLDRAIPPASTAYSLLPPRSGLLAPASSLASPRSRLLAPASSLPPPASSQTSQGRAPLRPGSASRPCGT